MRHSARGGCLRLLLLLIILIFGAAALAPLVPLDRYKPELESRFSRLLGRKVTIGSVRLSLLQGLALKIKGMTAREDPGFGEGNMLEADSVRAGLAFLPLALHRQFVLKSLEMDSPR